MTSAAMAQQPDDQAGAHTANPVPGQRVGFYGLGDIGLPMATHLFNARVELKVLNTLPFDPGLNDPGVYPGCLSHPRFPGWTDSPDRSETGVT